MGLSIWTPYHNFRVCSKVRQQKESWEDIRDMESIKYPHRFQSSENGQIPTIVQFPKLKSHSPNLMTDYTSWMTVVIPA